MTDSDRQIAYGGARSRLPVGMSFTNRDLLHAALMASDNRAVPALGRAVGLNPQQLRRGDERQGQGARHQEHARSKIPSGSTPTTSRRRAISSACCARPCDQPLISEITQKAKYVAHPVGKPRLDHRVHQHRRDRALGHVQVITGKTGYTDLALYCLAIAVRMAAAQPHEWRWCSSAPSAR